MGQEHNVALSSAGETSAFRLSVGFLDQEGVIQGTTVERLSAGLNYTQRLLDDRLQIRSSLKGSRAKDLFTPGGVLSNAAQMGPSQPVLDPTRPTGYYDWPGNDGRYNQLTSADNPVAILALATDQGTTWRSIGNVQAEYALPYVEGLRANVSLGYDITKATREQFTPGTLHSQIKTGTGGVLHRRDETFQSGLLETYLNYTTPAAFPGTLDLTGGYSYSQGHGEYPKMTAIGLTTDLLGNGAIPAADIVQNDLWIDDNKLISFFGRAQYNWNDRVMLTASLRRDGSSRFGEANAWGTFPAVAVAYRMTGLESFNMSDLKLRASWGKTGNQSFANYQQFSTYQVGDQQSQIRFGDEYVSTIRPSAADPNIKWEETNSYNFGIDYGFANNRFTGAIDVYRKDTDDLIFTVPIAAGTNLSNFLTTNIGSMRNTGIELSLSARILEGGRDGLNWTADFNAGHNKNELTQINPFGGSSQEILTGLVAGGVGTFIQVLTPGQPINSFFVYEHKMENGKPIYRDTNGDGNINENDLYVDLNGDGNINVDDRRPLNDPHPDWILGHSSYLSYGKFDASFTLRAYLGSYVYNNVASNLGTYAEVTRGSPYNLHVSVLETGFVQPQYLSDYYVEDASFLRMDNLTVGYNLTWRGQPLRVFGTIQNAFTMTGYSGVDPTAGLNGLDNNIYPRSRTFAAGLNVRF
jgi:iron complex outermembrane receptor protein